MAVNLSTLNINSLSLLFVGFNQSLTSLSLVIFRFLFIMRLQNPLSLLVAAAHVCTASPTIYWPPWMTGIVSTSWLALHSWDPTVLVIDTQIAEEYAAGHIPKAVNIPWVVPLSA